jgi:radical SAM superfamily enzyme YgiQ (UPF0313 family)
MPGQQLAQAIPFAERIRILFPNVVMIWGGYFASNQHQVVLESGWVDYVVDGPGDLAFPALLRALDQGHPIGEIPNLIFRDAINGEILKTAKAALPDYEGLNPLPYEKLHGFYDMSGYLPKTWLGKRTIAYHSSFGCPFTCSFCAVVPIYNARWKGMNAARIFEDVMRVRAQWGGDAVEFHDNNFFTNRARTVEFARLMLGQGMTWWGEGRIDTMDKYSDDDLRLLRESGCKIIFFGAETGDDSVLAQMDKGGTQTAAQIKRFAARLYQIGIVPEYSFVLGTPADSPQAVLDRINADIEFIRGIKVVNPKAEIILYMYSPVPTEGSELYHQVKASGFEFPTHLKDWLSPAWEKFDLRKNPLTPWLTPKMVDRVKDFETVLNARFPTASDIKLSPFQRKVMQWMGGWRYKLKVYRMPYEIKLLQKFWLKYRQPEIEGF